MFQFNNRGKWTRPIYKAPLLRKNTKELATTETASSVMSGGADKKAPCPIEHRMNLINLKRELR